MQVSAWLFICGLLLQGVCGYSHRRWKAPPGSLSSSHHLSSFSTSSLRKTHPEHTFSTSLSSSANQGHTLSEIASVSRHGNTVVPLHYTSSTSATRNASSSASIASPSSTTRDASSSSAATQYASTSSSIALASSTTTSSSSSSSIAVPFLPTTTSATSQYYLSSSTQTTSSSAAAAIITATSIAVAAIPIPTSDSAKATVTNPSNPAESVTFVKEQVSNDILAGLPIIPATGLAAIVMVGSVATPIMIDAAGMMVIPLGSVPSWLTPGMYPASDNIQDLVDATTFSSSSSSSSSTTRSTVVETISLSTLSITATSDVAEFTAIQNFPLTTGSGPAWSSTPSAHASSYITSSQPVRSSSSVASGQTDSLSQPVASSQPVQPSSSVTPSQTATSSQTVRPSSSVASSQTIASGQPARSSSSLFSSSTQSSSVQLPSSTSEIQSTTLLTTSSATTTSSAAPTPEISINTVAPRGNGTTINNDVGCISVNGQVLCHGWTQTAIRSDSDTTTVKIYAQIDGSSSTHENIQPGCELTASWPSYYGDVYFKGDNCLYDSQNNIIDNQCCSQSTTETVPNPYAPICKRQYKGVADWFDIWSDGWITDDGSTLHEALKSCGIVTMWNPTPIRDTDNYMIQFALPLQAGNCVGKAIYESGGPYVSC